MVVLKTLNSLANRENNVIEFVDNDSLLDRAFTPINTIWNNVKKSCQSKGILFSQQWQHLIKAISGLKLHLDIKIIDTGKLPYKGREE